MDHSGESGWAVSTMGLCLERKELISGFVYSTWELALLRVVLPVCKNHIPTTKTQRQQRIRDVKHNTEKVGFVIFLITTPSALPRRMHNGV
jgi:hypothetical protein